MLRSDAGPNYAAAAASRLFPPINAFSVGHVSALWEQVARVGTGQDGRLQMRHMVSNVCDQRLN